MFSPAATISGFQPPKVPTGGSRGPSFVAERALFRLVPGVAAPGLPEGSLAMQGSISPRDLVGWIGFFQQSWNTHPEVVLDNFRKDQHVRHRSSPTQMGNIGQ